MILIGCTPRLKMDNHLNMLTLEFDAEVRVGRWQVIVKMELIVGMHKAILGNVE
jgi:hypothetical protein